MNRDGYLTPAPSSRRDSRGRPAARGEGEM